MWMFLPYLQALLCVGSLLCNKPVPTRVWWALFMVVAGAWFAYHATDTLSLSL